MTRSRFLRFAVVALAAFGLVLFACNDDDDNKGSGILQTVTDRGELKCGVKETQPGFGFLSPDGSRSGNDVEFCRAVAAAVLGNANKVEFVPASAQDRFELLASGEIDVLIRTTTWTASRDADLKGDFVTTTFYDGQGMMVSSDSGISTLEDLAGATICVTSGTTTEGNLDDQFQARGIAYTPLSFEDDAQIQAAFIEGRCDGWTADKSNLAGQRANFPDSAGGSAALTILGETLSKEPLGPVTPDNDSEWHAVVQWVVFGMIIADEFDITSENVGSAVSSPANRNVARLLGVGFDGNAPDDFGLGIPLDFMQKVLAQVGNFNEVYQRTLTPIGLGREGSLNASWLKGGAIYAPPMR
ncbi:MAG: amino acid ABC transporter substrate-binding protein [Dehalococcoidia bacterium]|nr:amino acid ABC transporter substrate-binding protein [Dehalococcoidia bacterium]